MFKTKQIFNTIQQITKHQFIGNAHSDMDAFMSIDAFVQDTNNSLSDRAESLRIMSDKGMSCGRDEQMSDSEIVQDYIDHL